MATNYRIDTKYYLIELSDGTTITEQCRNTWGGYRNLVSRVERQLGSRMSVTSVADTDDAAGKLADGRTLTIAAVVSA